ncbi:hypothetical protein [Streptomyces sp. NPDC097619]|uniref:hypothetical protein n=1 Tax=Streptomyces sp. NPDC097619 TaxID=3157228 RepID=UPI00331F8265
MRQEGAGRSRWTTGAGRTMVLSGWAALLSVLVPGLAPYPPVLLPLGFAALSAAAAAVWVVSGHRVRAPRGPLDKPYRETRRPSRPLTYLFALGIPFASIACLLIAFLPAGADVREAERRERAGVSEHEVPVARLLDEPRRVGTTESDEPIYRTRLAFRVPYDSGVRDYVLPDHETVGLPRPGTPVSLWYAPSHPELPPWPDPSDAFTAYGSLCLLVWTVPFAGLVSAAVKSQMAKADVHLWRRFRARYHLPALAVLLLGAGLLVPYAAGFTTDPLWRFGMPLLAALTPWASALWLMLATSRIRG